MDLKSKLNWIKDTASQVSVEPFMFFFMIGFHSKLVSYQSLFVDRICRNVLDYSDDICDHIDDHQAVKISAVKIGNYLGIGNTLVRTIPALVVSIFLGPWSDKYGRKLPMVLATSGTLIDATIAAVLTFKTNIHPNYYLVSGFISGMTGGTLVVLSQTYSYLSDVTDSKTRPARFAVLEFCNIMASPLGTVMGAQVYNAGGYIAVMTLSPCFILCALLWLIFMVKEPKQWPDVTTKTQIIKDLCQLENFKMSFKTCLQPRPGNLRKQIWLLVFLSCSVMMINLGSAVIGFYYVNVVFKWDIEKYSNTNTIFFIVNALATLFLIPMFSRKFMLHEAALGLIGTFSSMAKLVLLAVSFKEVLIYYAWFCGCLASCAGIAIRSRMSKLVSKLELGRVYSLLATCESLMPFLGQLLMTSIYNASIQTYPGLAYAVAAVVMVPSAFIFGWMTTLPTMSFTQYQEEENKKAIHEMEKVASVK